MKLFFITLVLCVGITGCAQRTTKADTEPLYKNVGGGCEGCEAIYEAPLPFSKLPWSDTLPDFNEAGPKIKITGTVYRHDGKTPGADVVLYVYHTNQKGYYEARANATGWARRNGYIRGWVKTDRNGRYQFFTLKPAPYPGRNAPAHIHVVVKEPDKNEYYIDEFVFDDDPLLTATQQSSLENRGGSGIVHLRPESGLLTATRTIILGQNIPDYPMARTVLDSDFSLGLLYVLR